MTFTDGPVRFFLSTALFAAAVAMPSIATAGIEICFSGPCCDGGSFRPAKFVCRPAAGGCDVAETCTGSSALCPADAIDPARTPCRASTGVCDRSESCSGTSKDCPADAVRAEGFTCRAAAGPCDVAETCDGVTKQCAADSFSSPGVLCRVSAGDCDVEELCNGSSASCPADAAEEAGVLCRKALGECDVSESCDGSSTDCPADADRDGEACTDEVICLESEGTCDGKTCVGVVEKNCDDGDPCTQDLCDPGDGFACVHPPDDDGIDCDDGDACTTGDKCDTGVCVGAPVIGCDATTTTTAAPATTTTAAPETTTTTAGPATTTTLETVVCGDADADGKVEASDALAALRAAVGTGECAHVRCDWNGDGNLTAPDALFILREAVGQPGTPNCPETEPAAILEVPGSTTTTTAPAEP